MLPGFSLPLSVDDYENEPKVLVWRQDEWGNYYTSLVSRPVALALRLERVKLGIPNGNERRDHPLPGGQP